MELLDQVNNIVSNVDNIMIEHPVVQTVAGFFTLTSIMGWLPLFFGGIAAFYYAILVYEKITGKNFKDLFVKK